MKLYNTLTKSTEEFKPLKENSVNIYSCGPTVYDHIHIGNLRAFIVADTLNRVLRTLGYSLNHVMNFTDVDDKTITRSQEKYEDEDPNVALKKLTREYEEIFISDMKSIGNDVDSIDFERATESIEDMRTLITKLYDNGFAYIADDGVYFSIEAYQKSGKKYGQLVDITAQNTSSARINNDEYDKESIHDFALWKLQKDNEPAWEFELDGHSLLGRPGWHIECSVMSTKRLGQPFDIHTGGVDLIFPHHENEIAQSTAGENNPIFASCFVHNEHLLVDSKKMSKSLQNFFTLEDLIEKHYDPLAFRLMVLQAHYRSQMNFTWENLEAAQNRLKSLRAMADFKWQASDTGEVREELLNSTRDLISKALVNDMDTPVALADLSRLEQAIDSGGIYSESQPAFNDFIDWLDNILGLHLAGNDISEDQKVLISNREKARQNQEWTKSDEIRAQLNEQGITVRDTPHGPIWSRL